MEVFVNNSEIFRGGELENLKHGSELALVCNLLLASKIKENWALDTLERLWTDTFFKGNRFSNILVARPDMISALSTYTNFHECGFRNDDVLEWCQYVSNADWLSALPMPKWRLLDILNSLKRLGMRNVRPVDLDGCWIKTNPPLHFISTDISYAITHEIFYICDFGRSQDRMSSTTRDYLEIALPVWQNHFFRANDLDLCAEFILCQQIVFNRHDPTLFSKCRALQQVDGSFLGPERVRRSSVVSNDNLDDFRNNYHTTLVMCILLAYCSNSSDAPNI